MKIRNLTYFIVALLATGLLWGCGSSGGGGSSVSGSDGEFMVETLGITNCVKCHSAASPETLSWLESAHGNPNRSPSSVHLEGSSCQSCHNPLLDSEAMETAFTDLLIGQDRDGLDVYANDRRDVVTCEACHGGGSAHRGLGPVPYPRPDWQQCVQCHDHAEGVRHADNHGLLASNVGASAHNNSDDLHAGSAKCQRCHTAEGATKLTMYTGDKNLMAEMDEDNDNVASLGAEEDLHPVTCSACHIPHNDSGRWESFIVNDNSLASGNWDPNGNGVADEFDFCTSCHTYYNQDGVLIGSGSAASGTAPFYHNTAWYRMITSTHYDDPTTGYDLDENIIEGYVIREDSPNPCFDCHGHELRTNTRRHLEDPALGADYGPTIHTDWANSRHGGELLKAKVAAADANPVTARRGQAGYEDQGMAQVDAVMSAGREDEVGKGWSWTHYDWDAGNRESCQYCHTSTGFANYASDPASYDPATNDFSHLTGWNRAGDGTVTSSGQNEMLYCWGCHDNAQTGTLRIEDAVTASYTFGGEDVVFPDNGASNTCYVCHSGRGNNETVSTSSRFAGHHAPAAATLFNELTHVGGEYVGLDYTNVPYFAHDSIDSDGAGSCVACHMDNGSHTFAAVEKDDSGIITDIVATNCVDCHSGNYALTPAILNEESAGYQDAGQLLLDIINEANELTNYTGATINQSNAEDNDRRAFQNSKIATEEKAGYAHNRYYVKRLIFDGIDWAEDGAIDGTISDYSDAGYADAMSWLGTTRP